MEHETLYTGQACCRRVTTSIKDIADLFIVVDVLLKERLDFGLIVGHCRCYADDVLIGIVPYLRQGTFACTY